jgi:hypothetical protein
MSESSEPGGAGEGEKAVATLTEPARALRRGYFARHWRGELTLPYAWWINGLAVGLIAFALATSVGPALEIFADAPLVVMALTTVWTLVTLLAVWQVVGIWRCAQRHARAEAGGGGHAAMARLALLVGVMIALGAFVRSGLPQIVEASQFAMGKDPIGDYTMQPLHNGTALGISGPIVFGLTDSLEKMLAQYPRVSVLHLDSTGGRVVEARKLRDLIRARGLATFAAGNCASACVVAFVAGAERVVGRAGSIGFHRYRSPGLDESEIEASMAVDRRELAQLGAPDWFLDKAFSTPNADMWRPSIADLKRANIVTSVTSTADLALSLQSDRAAIEAYLLKTPLYGAVKRHEPTLFRQVVDEMEQRARRGLSFDEAAVRARPILGRLAAKYLPAASDQAIVQAMSTAAQTMRTLQSHSADECYRYIQPGSRPADLSLLPNELRQQDLASTAAIIETGARGQPHPRGEVTQDDLRWVYALLVEQFGEDAGVLNRLNAPNVNANAACGVVAALYENAIKLPAPRNAQLLRFLLAGN